MTHPSHAGPIEAHIALVLQLQRQREASIGRQPLLTRQLRAHMPPYQRLPRPILSQQPSKTKGLMRSGGLREGLN